jgi:nucleoside-diphosphate-sugar epimerase
MTRVAVFGASGFVGATLVERAQTWPDVDLRPVIHGSGSAARLARHGMPLHSADLLVPGSIDRALAECTHVVNCSRGPAEVMTKGFANLLEACRRAGVQRFVHISSVAVYEGAQGSIDESAPARPSAGTYGAMKLAQDQMVARAASRGLSSIVLCPPNISGPHSAFLLEIVRALQRREFALVDDGCLPCALVDVENLVHAIRLALHVGEADPRRIFVTDGEPVNWGTLAEALAPLADHPLPLPSISRPDAERRAAEATARRPSVLRAARHLVSSDVRSALRSDPWLAQAEKRLKAVVKAMPILEPFARRQAAPAARPAKVTSGPLYGERLLRQQLRGVQYSGERAAALLGYVPPASTGASMQAFRAWYETSFGWNDEWWPLVRHLQDSDDRTPPASRGR